MDRMSGRSTHDRHCQGRTLALGAGSVARPRPSRRESFHSGTSSTHRLQNGEALGDDAIRPQDQRDLA